MKNKGYTLVELLVCVAVIVVVLALLVPFVLWTDRSLDFWLTYWAGHAKNCPMWLSALTTIVLNGLVLIFNVITELFRLAKGL